jgi:hypothetical protein
MVGQVHAILNHPVRGCEGVERRSNKGGKVGVFIKSSHFLPFSLDIL